MRGWGVEGGRVGLLEEADKRNRNPPGLGLRENVLVDLHHEVTSRRKLRHEAGVAGGLEAGVEGQQEGVPRAAHGLQDPLLAVQAAGEGGGFRGKENPHWLGPATHRTPKGQAATRSWFLGAGGTWGSFNRHNHHCPI